MPTILLSGHKFSYTVNRKPTKSFSLRLKSKHSFAINCHFLTPNFLINNFINGHSGWIVNNSAKFQNKAKAKDLKTVTILDNKYQLIITKSAHDSAVIYRDQHQIYLNTVSTTSSHLRTLLDKKLRPYSLQLIKSSLSDLSSQFGFKYHRISVRNQSSRFGSCSSRGNLNFNWQIILFPFDKFQHILLHELTHLSIKDHSAKFWHQLSVYDPDCKANNLWLKKTALQFMLFS